MVRQTSERSGLEQDLGQTVAQVRAKRAAEEGQAEVQLYGGDPYGTRTAAPGQSLPSPPVSLPSSRPPPPSHPCPVFYSSLLSLCSTKAGSLRIMYLWLAWL